MYAKFKEHKFLESLVKHRKFRGFTQKQVEKNLGLRPLSMYDYEKGRLKVPVGLLVSLANLYQCTLEDLLALEERESLNDPILSDQLSSLTKLGLIGTKQDYFAQLVFKDPMILAEVDVAELELQEAPLQMITKNLSDQQRKAFIIELLKYVNSVIGVDEKVTAEEVALKDSLLANFSDEMTEADKNSVARALSKKYFGKSVEKKFPRRALKHFALWTLFVVALSDGRFDPREEEYIEEVSVHLGVKTVDFEFIKKNILKTFMKRI